MYAQYSNTRSRINDFMVLCLIFLLALVSFSLPKMLSVRAEAIVLVVEQDTDINAITKTLNNMDINVKKISYIKEDGNNIIEDGNNELALANTTLNSILEFETDPMNLDRFLEVQTKDNIDSIKDKLPTTNSSEESIEPTIKEEPVIEKEEPIFPVLDKKATKYDDLAVFEEITEDQLNYIIDKFDKLTGGTPFKGKAHIFMEASELSGLNPLYLFAHASLETGYGTSSLARNKGNYFGIAAYDSNPSGAYHMGDTMRDGIVNGALWIKENFYNNSQTTLYDMIYKYENHCYATSGDKWINGILWIMNKFSVENYNY